MKVVDEIFNLFLYSVTNEKNTNFSLFCNYYALALNLLMNAKR